MWLNLSITILNATPHFLVIMYKGRKNQTIVCESVQTSETMCKFGYNICVRAFFSRYRALFIGPVNTFFNKKIFKTGSYNTIHIFKNYFITVFSVETIFNDKHYLNRSCLFLLRVFTIIQCPSTLEIAQGLLLSASINIFLTILSAPYYATIKLCHVSINSYIYAFNFCQLK